MHNSPRRPIALAALALILALTGRGPAQSTTWNKATGGPFNWTDAANWSAGVPNSATATANVNNDLTANVTINLGALIDLNVLNLGDSTSTFFGFTVAPGAGGSLQFSGASAAITSRNAANVISAPVTLLAATTVTHTSTAGSLNLSGGINTGVGGAAQTLTVGATNNSTGATTSGVLISGAITGDGGLTKLPGGFLNLTSAANTYTGPTVISGGAIRVSGAGVIGGGNLSLSGGGQFFPSATFTRDLGTGAGQVQWTGTGGFGTLGQALAVNLGGAAATVTWASGGFVPDGSNLALGSTSSDNTITFANPIDLNGATRTVAVTRSGAVAVDAVFSGAFGGAAGSGLIKTGTGTARLDATPTFSGVLTVNQGVLLFGTGVSIGTSNLAVTGGSVVAPTAGTTFTATLGTGAGQLDLAPTGGTVGGGFGAVGGPVTVNLGGAGAAVTWATANFVPDAQALLFSSASSDNTVTFQNAIDLNAGAALTARTVQANNGSAAVDTTISGVIGSAANSANAALIKSGTGLLELTGLNTYGGGTSVTGGSLRIGSDGVNPGDASPLGAVPATPGVNITLSGGTLQFGASFALHANRQISLSTVATNGGLDTNGFNITLPNLITGPGNLVKSGAGTLTLTAPAGGSTYAGTTTVSAGTLAIGADNTLPTTTALVLGGGTNPGNLDLSSFSQTVTGLQAVSDSAAGINTVTVGSGKTFAVTNPVAPTNADTINMVPFIILNNTGGSTVNGRTNVNFTGAGTFAVNTPLSPFHVGQAGSLPTFGNLGTVDMSGLATFVIAGTTPGSAGATELRVGDFGNTSNPGATILTLAQSNTITVSRSISVGTSGRFTNSGPAGFQTDTLKLGSSTNVLNANNLYIGSNVRNGADTSTINLITAPRASGAVVFNTATGSVTLRASDGTGRSNIFLGALSAGTSAARANTFDVTGHNADLLLDQLVVGAPNAYSTPASPNLGTLDNVFSFNNGTLDVNTIAVARQAGTGAATTTYGPMTGTVNLGGGSVTVNTGPITLATATGTIATSTVVTNTGTLNVSGGTVTVRGGGITLGNNGTGTTAAGYSLVGALNVSGGTLTVSGPIGPGAGTGIASNLTLSGGLLNLQGNDVGTLTNINFTGGTLRDVGNLARGFTMSGGTFERASAGATNVAGAVAVTDGTVRVTAAGGTLTTTGLTLAGASQLTGVGTVAGPVTFQPSATVQTTLAPGNSPGVLTLSGAVTLADSTRVAYELNGPNPGTGYDQIDLVATGTIGLGNATLGFDSLGFDPTTAAGGQITLVTGSAGTPQVSGIFGGLPGGSQVFLGTFSGQAYGGVINYAANSVFISGIVPVPEPAHVLLLCAAAGGIARWRLRRRAGR